MHWTLVLLLFLCLLCVTGNAVQFAVTGTVRMAGVLACTAWAVCQFFNLREGDDSLILFGLAYGALLAWAWKHKPLSVMDRVVVALIVPASAIAGLDWYERAFGPVGDNVARWWAGWAIIAAQMVLGLPWRTLQPANYSVSHGPLKPKADTKGSRQWGQ